MTTGKNWRWSLVAGLAVVLVGSSIGCHPASTTGPTPTTVKATNKQPDDKKDAPGKPPPNDPG